MPAGGKRIGAGRKTDFQRELIAKAAIKRAGDLGNAIASTEAVQDLEASIGQGHELLIGRILARQGELVDAMVDLALGVKIEQVNKDGEASVYHQPPDRQAVQWLLEQVHGKATQKHEVTKDTTIHLVSGVPRPEPKALAAVTGEEVIDTDAEVEYEDANG